MSTTPASWTPSTGKSLCRFRFYFSIAALSAVISPFSRIIKNGFGSRMAPRLLVITGAPEASSLNWEEVNLSSDSIVEVSRFNGEQADGHRLFPYGSPDASRNASWRSLSLAQVHLPTGYTPIHGATAEYHGNTGYQGGGNASFFSTSDLAESFGKEISRSEVQESAEEVLSQFYEHSLAVHDNVASSQIQAVSFSDSGSSFTSTVADSFSSSQSQAKSPPKPTIPVAGQTANLKDIPNAAHVENIRPQTMTVNLIVGIISNSQSRLIKTRRGVDVEIVEMLVGDETRAGFGVTFWLSIEPVKDGKSGGDRPDNLRSVLEGLRPQDIVLLKNVALSSFRGKVYGQSLRKDMTKAYLLFRNRVDRSDQGGCYTVENLNSEVSIGDTQVIKTMLVRDWVLRFVGSLPGKAQPKQDQQRHVQAQDSMPQDSP